MESRNIEMWTGIGALKGLIIGRIVRTTIQAGEYTIYYIGWVWNVEEFLHLDQ